MPETMSPRERVARTLFERGRGAHDAESWEVCGDEMRDWLFGHADAILAALASSVDHAGLKRLADEAADFGVPAKVDPSVLNALIAEVAALRGERDAMTDNYDRATRLHASTCRDLTEAERKLAEADQVIRDIADTPYSGADWPRSRAATYLASKEAERG